MQTLPIDNFTSGSQRQGKRHSVIAGTLRHLQVGQSFLVPQGLMTIDNVRSSTYQFGRRNDRDFTVVREVGGYRVNRLR